MNHYANNLSLQNKLSLGHIRGFNISVHPPRLFSPLVSSYSLVL